MDERWGDIPGFVEMYQVSTKGRVKSMSRLRPYGKGFRPIYEKLLKPCLSNGDRGYLTVDLCKNGVARTFGVHVLVLRVFVGECPDGMECLHNDGDPTNNCLDNLSWGSSKQNARDRSRHGRTAKGERHPNARFTEETARECLILRRTGHYTLKQLAEKFEVSIPAVGLLTTGVNWRHLHKEISNELAID